MIRAARENTLKTKMFGGNMIGLLATVFKIQLGPLLNGVVSTADTFLPSPTLEYPGVKEVLAKYQARAPKEGVDPLGYNYAPLTYAAMQVLQQAVEATKSLDQAKLAAYMHSHTFNTVSGPIAFGPDGEWTKPRIIVSQFQGVDGHGLGQFKDAKKQVIVWPKEYKSGDLIYPYSAAQQ
jgi:branched-chain amino acid transport system substrate-binding protein